jgi:hypothetical protein
LTSGQTRYKGRGKLDLHSLPADIGNICSDLRDHVNSLQASIQKEFTTSLGTEPKLYFDFLDATEANALAFTDGEWSFIGLTGGFLSQTALQLQKLTARTAFHKWLAVPSGHYQSEPNAVLVSLFRLVQSFVWAHELGHHVYGHVPFQIGVQCFRLEATTCSSESGSLRSQAGELDADQHGVQTLLNQLARDPDSFFEGSLRGLATASPNRDLQLRLLLTAITLFFLSSQQCPHSAATISKLTHPPRLIRIDYVAGVMRDWLKEHSLISELSRADFCTLVDCIEEPTGGAARRFNTEQQANALSCKEWAAYLRGLKAARNELRKDNEQLEWKRR